MNLTVTIDTGDLMASLDAITAAMQDSAGMHKSISEAAGQATKDHLTEDYLPRDGPRGDFWADVIDSTQVSSDDSTATVALTELGVALRYHGGEVTPGKSISSFTGQPTRALAIPSDQVPVSDGRQIRPGRAGLLAFIQSRTAGETVGHLVEGLAIARKRDTKRGKKGTPYIVPRPGGSLMYTLRTITRHKGDPHILPSDERLIAAASGAAVDFVDSFEA